MCETPFVFCVREGGGVGLLAEEGEGVDSPVSIVCVVQSVSCVCMGPRVHFGLGWV